MLRLPRGCSCLYHCRARVMGGRKKIDRSGEVVSGWLLLERIEPATSVTYRCVCPSCKKEYTRVLQGIRKSVYCSRCWHSNNSGYKKHAEGHASRNALLFNYKTAARNRGYSFELSADQAFVLFKGDCYYCGVPPCRVHIRPCNNGNYTYNGIDRMDNSKGYTPENSVSCCGDCNVGKLTMSAEAFIELAHRVAVHHKKEKSA